MKLPDAEARARILSDHLKNLPEELRQPNAPRLITAAEGITGPISIGWFKLAKPFTLMTKPRAQVTGPGWLPQRPASGTTPTADPLAHSRR